MFQRALRLLPLLCVCCFGSAAFAQANLTLDDVAFVQQLAPGSLFVVDADYENSGPSAATDFKMTITVPAGVLYKGYSADPRFHCTEPPKDGQGDLVCTAASVGVISSDAIEADLRVDPALAPGTMIPIQATLTSSNAAKPSQTISKQLTVLQPANLHLEMSAPSAVTAGDTFTTTIAVTNQGPGSAVNTRVTFTHDAHVIASRLTGPAGWTCSSLCINPSFAPGTTATFTVTSTVPSNWILPTLTESAATFSVSDPDFSDDGVTSTIAVTALPHANLTLSAVADKNAVFTGELVTETFTVTNPGPDAAQSLLLEIELPHGSTFSPVISTFATCGTTLPIVCTAPSLAVGGTLTATISFHAPSNTGLFSADGTISWSGSSPVSVVTYLQAIAGDPTATRHRAARH